MVLWARELLVPRQLPASSVAQPWPLTLPCRTNSFNGAGWTGWAKIGGIEIGNPSCASLGTTKVICAVVGLNGKAVSTVGP